MTSYIVIRNYKPGDELACRQILHEAVMSTIKPSFFTALTREITLHLIVIMAAIMFVFMGLPPSICLCAIPATVVVVFVGVYLGHTARAYGMMDDVYNIPRNYMSTEFTGFWVAEAYEPAFKFEGGKDLHTYMIVGEKEYEQMTQGQTQAHVNRKIVGTIAVTRSKVDAESAWLRRMAVMPKYQRRGIASALVKEVIRFCQERGYDNIDLITTECHDGARELYMRKGFELKQLYHKQILGNIIQVLMYELTYKLTTVRPSLDIQLVNKQFVLTKC